MSLRNNFRTSPTAASNTATSSSPLLGTRLWKIMRIESIWSLLQSTKAKGGIAQFMGQGSKMLMGHGDYIFLNNFVVS